MKFRVEVTQEDIAAGRATDCERCPIARAANRALEVSSCMIGVKTLYLRKDDVAYVAFLPQEARTFINTFDHGYPVLPITFDLEATEC